ncbi:MULTISPECIES: RHS repeat-associated core domain-containing protein, partial [unclassified Pseudomonas]|uniref:RHS repeat-associated core domain-containing protein n=1 Tax=unclassified Pseudomonas TaxID=196821 RepID=UPI00159434AA
TQHRSFIYEPGTFRPLAMLDGQGPKRACPFYYQLDHLGTPQELTDYSGDIVWSAKYAAYGKVTSLQLATDDYLDQPLRFQGQYFDAESGLHYNRHRYYDPDAGRYLTPDPVKLAGGLNQYRYVPNPTGWVDPLGLTSNCPPPNRPGCSAPDGVEGSKVNEGEPKLPLREKEGEYLYRGDVKHPDEVFKNGFKSKGQSTDLLLHAMDSNNPPSYFISTSPSEFVAIEFGTSSKTRKGYLYTLRKILGINVNKTLGNQVPFADEIEVAIPGSIHSADIIGVTPLKKDGSYVGYSIPNPKRK